MPGIRFQLNGHLVEVNDLEPTITLLQYLRATGLCGTKEGCAEGDCGACSVAILDPGAPEGPAWRAVNSCLVFLPMLQGREVRSVEGIADGDTPHPAQQHLVDRLGSQCGYCTPGIVMSLFEACYRDDLDADWKVDDQLCGNLCRCTGYRPIREAALAVAALSPRDRFSAALDQAGSDHLGLHYEHGNHRYQCPESLPDLWDAIDRAPQARFIVGGTDLALHVTKRFEQLPDLISLEGITELRAIRPGPERWSLGATTTLSDLEAGTAEGLPLIARMLRFFASRQIKNRATLGGNLCNASPIGDMAPVLMALGAELVLSSRGGDRRVPLDGFFLDYRKTALQAGEILTSVEVPLPDPALRMGAYKVSKRRELDISAVCAGFALRLDAQGCVADIRLCYGGMAATTARASHTEQALIGKPWNEAAVEAATGMLTQDFQPIDDQRGSAWYRATLAGNLLRGFYLETLEQPFRPLPERPSSTLVLEESP